MLRHAFSNGDGRRAVAHDHAVEPDDLFVGERTGQEPIPHAALVLNFVSGMAKRGDGGVDAAPRRRDGHAGGVVGMGEAPDQLIGKHGLVLAGVLA